MLHQIYGISVLWCDGTKDGFTDMAQHGEGHGDGNLYYIEEFCSSITDLQGTGYGHYFNYGLNYGLGCGCGYGFPNEYFGNYDLIKLDLDAGFLTIRTV